MQPGIVRTRQVLEPLMFQPDNLGSVWQIAFMLTQERKQFDEKFVKMDTKKLCELTSAADSLEMRPLVDMASRALARLIEGKSPEEIREAFNLPDDLSEEEKLEPVKNLIDDPRIRLLNRLFAKKRKVHELTMHKKHMGSSRTPCCALFSWTTLRLQAVLNCGTSAPCCAGTAGKKIRGQEGSGAACKARGHQVCGRAAHVH